jgi:hypothetical protein
VPYGQGELELVYKLYRLRKENAGNAAVQAQLGLASAELAALNISGARAILDAVAVPGDFDHDGDADGGDFMKWQQQLGAQGLFPLVSLDADGNADGFVDVKDLEMLIENFGNVGGALTVASEASHAVPEPIAMHLVLLATLATRLSRLTP